MAIDPRLENYLASLDRALAPIAVSERADIVMEIKSHVISALERDPSQSLETVLTALGEPETVANRYLLERGLKPGKPPISPVVKWIVIGVLGSGALLLAFVIALLLWLSPIVEVNSKEDRVRILGGLIQVDGDDFFIGAKLGGGSESRVSETELAPGQLVGILFTNARIRLMPASGRNLSWSCQHFAGDMPTELQESETGLTLDLSSTAYVNCEISVPDRVELQVRGSNGSLQVERPRFSTDIRLSNGKVEIRPDRSQRYSYEFTVGNGKADRVDSDPDPQHRIAANVANGKIEVRTRRNQ